MSLLTPEIGLLFWMFVSFGIVFFVGMKYGFPVIVKIVDARKAYIDQSLEAARQASKHLEGIKEEGERLLKEVHKDRMLILKEANEMRVKMINQAKEQAQIASNQLLEEAKASIQKEKESAMQDIQKQVVDLSMNIAEKILRKNLDNSSEQWELIDKLIKELN